MTRRARAPRIMTFDTESSLNRDGLVHGFSQDPQSYRDFIAERKQPVRLWCAVVHDSRTGGTQVFKEDEAARVVAMLEKADQLAGHSSRWRDLPVLESQVGEERMAALWAKPHHGGNLLSSDQTH